MYGYSQNTVIYWGVEVTITVCMALLLCFCLLKKQRWAAYVYPVGQLLIRLGALVFQPTDYGYLLSVDKAAVLIGLAVCSALMPRNQSFGLVTAVLCVIMLIITLPQGLDGIGAYFTFGGELTFLAVQVIAAGITHLAIGILGIQFVVGCMRPSKDRTEE